MGDNKPPTAAEINEERARELLDHSNASVRSELEHAEGWLRSAETPSKAPGWQVDAIAGALGSLANVWGRLTLWARGNGTYGRVRDDLNRSMDELTVLHQKLVREGQTEGDLDALQGVLQQLQQVHRVVERGQS